MKRNQVSYHVEIVRDCLAKTYAGIDYYLAPLYAIFDGKSHPLFQKCDYLGNDAFINRD